MKLKNWLATLQQNARKTRSLLQLNPFTDRGRKKIAREIFNRGRRKLENLEIPQAKPTSVKTEDTADYYFEPLVNPYPQYDKCYRNDPLNCDRSLEILKKAPLAKFCSQCGFPAPLPENREIKGKKGTYRVQRWLCRQGRGRIYAAVQQTNGQPVTIEEYLLPSRCFSSRETRQQIAEAFTRATNFQVAEAISSDFRLIIPSEAIGNCDRCYLITPGNLATLPSLKSYLMQRGRMDRELVMQLLDQVLQSLEFLHSQKWQFTSGQIKQGLIHGNLSLDSLLIAETEVGFLVYLWDLSCWSDLFDPTISQVSTNRIADDLVALGNIGFYLLASKEIVASAKYPLDPRNELNWQGISPQIKSFLLQLLGLNNRFNDAATAREELRKLMYEQTERNFSSAITVEKSSFNPKTFNWLPWTISSAIIILLGGFWLLKIINGNDPPPDTIETILEDCCIEDISNIPTGNFSYGVEASSKLKSIFQIEKTYSKAYKINSKISSFTEILSQEKNVNLTLETFSDREQIIDSLDTRKLKFALMNSTRDRYQKKFLRDDNEQVINNIVAYDGLLVYVPFLDCGKNCAQLGDYLNQKITLQQLRDIYTAKISYWHQIDPKIPKIPLEAFVPENELALELFKQLLFAEESEIAAFDEALRAGKIKQRESYTILKEIREMWLKGKIANGTKIGGIGFDLQEIVYKQCNVYPLAVVQDNSDYFPMLVNKQNQQGIDLFQDLSCKDKQAYQLNEAIFQDSQYPLAFSLNLLYLNNNQNQNLEFGAKITEIFKTQEFQCHLAHKKLIPLKLSERDCKR